MENIKIFEKHFKNGMINKDFDEFRRTHPRLLQCILNAMNEVLPQANVIKSVCECEPKTYRFRTSDSNKCIKCGEEIE